MGNSLRILDFSKLRFVDSDLISKKAKVLGELKSLKILIPDGFVITNHFFEEFLSQTGIAEEIKRIRNSTHPALSESLPKLLEPIQRKIMQSNIPNHLTLELHNFYRKLSGLLREASLNIYSSAKNSNHIAFYNVRGDANLILKIKSLMIHYLDQPFCVVIQKEVLSKNKKTTATNDPTIDNQDVLKLAKKIQKHLYFPQEIDYAIEKGKIYITDIRPFTGKVEKSNKVISQNKKVKSVLIKGISINPGIVTGVVKILNSQNLTNIKNFEIAVIKNLNKSLYSGLKKAKAVVADNVLQTPQDKLYYRKLIKTPTIMNTKDATNLLQNGNVITVNGSNGEIYSGGFI